MAAGALELHPLLADGTDATVMYSPLAREKIEAVRTLQVDRRMRREGRVVRGRSGDTRCLGQLRSGVAADLIGNETGVDEHARPE